jgi:hypothetical protein
MSETDLVFGPEKAGILMLSGPNPPSAKAEAAIEVTQILKEASKICLDIALPCCVF